MATRSPAAERKTKLEKTKTKAVKQLRAEAVATGLLPHEWLLRVSRGEAVPVRRWAIKYGKDGREVSRTLVEEEAYADLGVRIECAKAAAPFYAPRLATQTVVVRGNNEQVAKALLELSSKLPD